MGIFLFFSLSLTAQHKITLYLTAVPQGHAAEPVFVAGNFNGWNPAVQPFILKNDTLVAEFNDLKAGAYQFKFTRGSWDKVECLAGGTDLENHVVNLYSDTSFFYVVEAWKDDFALPEKTHTTSPNVQVIDTAFEMPQLQTTRRIWIYLPPGYNNSKRHYPVMYLQDGQNVFDSYTSAFGEWGVDECLDSLIEKGRPGCIVVAIDHGGNSRMSEYNPFEFTWKDSASAYTFTPRGDAYLDFIVQTLKPHIDQQYRTLTRPEHTIIAGSSMGGLIAYYAMLKYQSVFGKAGIFSPAFWTASGLEALTDSAAGTLGGKYFFYIGGKEGARHIQNMVSIQEKLGRNSSAMIYSLTDAASDHNEAAWRKWFAEFYNWIMADGYNVITGAEH